MMNVNLTDTDNSKKDEAGTVIASLIDWREAFPRPCCCCERPHVTALDQNEAQIEVVR